MTYKDVLVANSPTSSSTTLHLLPHPFRPLRRLCSPPPSQILHRTICSLPFIVIPLPTCHPVPSQQCNKPITSSSDIPILQYPVSAQLSKILTTYQLRSATPHPAFTIISAARIGSPEHVHTTTTLSPVSLPSFATCSNARCTISNLFA